MLQNLEVLLVITFIVISEAIAQFFVKKCRVERAWCYFLVAIVFYAFVCAGLYMTYQYQAMGVVNALWSAASVIAITLVGIIWYHETLNSNDYIGMAMILAGVYMIFVRGH